MCVYVEVRGLHWPLHSFETGSLTEPKPLVLVRITDRKCPASTFPVSGVRDKSLRVTVSAFTGVLGIKTQVYAHTASILPIKPSS